MYTGARLLQHRSMPGIPPGNYSVLGSVDSGLGMAILTIVITIITTTFISSTTSITSTTINLLLLFLLLLLCFGFLRQGPISGLKPLLEPRRCSPMDRRH